MVPAKDWVATAQVAGEVEYVHPELKKGALLKAGTEIIRISTADYELAIAKAEADLRANEARITEIAVSEKNTRQILAIEKRRLELQVTELERQRALLKRGTVSQTAFDQAMRDTLDQRKEVQTLENNLRLLPTQRTVETEQLAVFKAAFESAKLNLIRTGIRLPFDVRVAAVDVEVGRYAQVGQSLATADGVAVAEVEAQMPIVQFRNMAGAVIGGIVPQGMSPGINAGTIPDLVKRMGFAVTVRLNDGGQGVEWPARFARISDTIDPKTRTLGIIAAVDGPYTQAVPGRKPPLAKGLFVEVELRARAQSDQLVVPRSALGDGTLLIANNENRLEIRPVTVTLRQGDLVSISEGLKPGERVVVSDVSPAIPGMLLNTTPDTKLMETIRRAAAHEGPRL